MSTQAFDRTVKNLHDEEVVLFGIPVDNLTMEETVDRIERMIRDRSIHQHVVINVDKIVKIEKNEQLRRAVLDCDLINADGQPVIWVSKILGRPLKERVTGIDLFDALMARCAESGFRPYLVGARGEVTEKAVDVLKSRYPKLQLAGWRDGYWGQEEEPQVDGDQEGATRHFVRGDRVAQAGNLSKPLESRVESPLRHGYRREP